MEGGILPSTKQSSTLRVNFINLKPLLLLKYEMENFRFLHFSIQDGEATVC